MIDENGGCMSVSAMESIHTDYKPEGRVLETLVIKSPVAKSMRSRVDGCLLKCVGISPSSKRLSSERMKGREEWRVLRAWM